MKTKLLGLFAAILSLSALSSCNAPYDNGSSSDNGGYSRQYGNNATLGGYRGGGGGGGFGGGYGGFGGR